MPYHVEGVMKMYQRMLVQYITVHPAKIHKYHIYYKENRIEKKYLVDFYYSEKALIECQKRVDFALKSELLKDICYMLGLRYEVVRKAILISNLKRIERIIQSNIINETKLEQLKNKLKNPCQNQ